MSQCAIAILTGWVVLGAEYKILSMANILDGQLCNLCRPRLSIQ